MISHLIIAVDDMPDRYTHLRRLVAPMGWLVVVVEHPTELEAQILDSPIPVLAVLLDHDLRPVWADVKTGQLLRNVAPNAKRWGYDDVRVYTGEDYARDILAARSTPVIVTSANQGGAQRIAAVLREFETPHAVISCVDVDHERRWVGQLAVWAANDR